MTVSSVLGYFGPRPLRSLIIKVTSMSVLGHFSLKTFRSHSVMVHNFSPYSVDRVAFISILSHLVILVHGCFGITVNFTG